MSDGKCAHCQGDGWREVFDDDGWCVGARECEYCHGTGKAQ